MRFAGSLKWQRCVAIATAVAWLGLPMLALAGDERPNLIFFLSDDQGIDAIEAANWPNDLDVITPNLDHFARHGRTFSNVRVNPYCSPTRAAIMTGRHGLTTGVTGVVNENRPRPDRDRVSLHPSERTLGEMLQDLGYYTVFVDKWHLGWDDSLGLMPEQQGFDIAFNWPDYIELDDPVAVGDEHLSLMVDFAIDSVEDRPNSDQPYALFLWSVDPHKRPDYTGAEPLLWWKVDEDLLPSGEDYYDEENNVNRYRAVVEAVDTEFERLLDKLDVIDSDGHYRGSSDTVVIYMSDNGTPSEVAPNPDKAKGSLYEGGIRVPLIVFGEGVPSDGNEIDRLVSHVDLYDTIADIVDASPSVRGRAPRDSMSFADSVGYSSSAPERQHSISSIGDADAPTSHRVAITDGRYKLFGRAGGAGLDPRAFERFFDLDNDPDEEENLRKLGMNASQSAAYERLRTELTRQWASAVGTPLSVNIDVPHLDTLALDDNDDLVNGRLLVGHTSVGNGNEVETRSFVRFDIEEIDALLPPDKDVDDIELAEIVLAFQGDATGYGTDTGPIRAHVMETRWHQGRPHWNDLADSVDPTVVGLVDLPPHVIPNPEGDRLTGVPIPFGTPVSLGPSTELADVVRDWYSNPRDNYGVVLIAERLNGTPGDQQVNFLTIAGIRLTLRD